MNVIINWIDSIFQCLFTIVQIIYWLLDGISKLVPLLVQSLNILGEVFLFFPSPISGIILAIVGGLVALRLCMWR